VHEFVHARDLQRANALWTEACPSQLSTACGRAQAQPVPPSSASSGPHPPRQLAVDCPRRSSQCRRSAPPRQTSRPRASGHHGPRPRWVGQGQVAQSRTARRSASRRCCPVQEAAVNGRGRARRRRAIRSAGDRGARLTPVVVVEEPDR
jgi:hypothetical protein